VAQVGFEIAMSLGYTAGPEQSKENPLGIGGTSCMSGRFHSPRGGRPSTLVTDGIAAALELARRAARGRDVSLAGGASTAQWYLGAGLVDEMEIHLVPMRLGAGDRLFGGVRDLGGLQHVRTVAAPNVTHRKFVRR
jgi:dihydrofolate reductase